MVVKPAGVLVKDIASVTASVATCVATSVTSAASNHTKRSRDNISGKVKLRWLR